MINGESKATRLAMLIEDEIRTAPLLPGHFLGTKTNIMAQYKVSAGTINEVLRLLQSRGFIEVKPGPKGGVFVAARANRAALTHGLIDTQIDASHLETLIEFQDALEEIVVVLAARKCNGDSAAKIGIALAVLSQATSPREIFTAAWALDAEIARATEDPVVVNIYCGIIQAMEQSMEWLSVGEIDVEDTIRVHAEIAGAVMRNDEVAARQGAKRHSPGTVTA